MSNEKKLGDRPPYTRYRIMQTALAGELQEAQNMNDENEIFYEAKAGESRRLFLEIEKMKRGYLTEFEGEFAS